MTGVKISEKTAANGETNPDRNKPVRGERKRFVLIGAIASLSTALVLGAIFCAVIFSLQNKKHVEEKKEWISWTRRTGKVDIHESVLINEDEQTILMVSAEAYRINQQNSMALYDFKLGYVALRDFKDDLCLVTGVSDPDFTAVKKMLEARQGKQLELQTLKHGTAEARNMTTSELGAKIGQFCDGVPAHWFHVTEKSGIAKRRNPPWSLELELEAKLKPKITLSSIKFDVEFTVTLRFRF